MGKEAIKELTTIFIAIVVLSLTVLFKRTDKFLIDFGITFLSFLIIIGVSVLVKKLVAYRYEADITTKFWELYRYGFKKGSHLKKSTPMVWLPILATLLSRGTFWWLGVLEFDIRARPERVSKRHGLYRFTEMTERHLARIAIWGVVACLIMALIGYLAGFETFTKLATYYAAWSLIPISSLDGTKIFFGNRGMWTTLVVLTGFFLAAAMAL